MGQKLAKTELFAKWLAGNLVVADQGVSTGRRIWVDDATGTDAGGYGASPDAPVATLDYAVGLCTDNKGDVIYLMPGHSESQVADAVIATVDIEGVHIIGLGVGADRPTFSLEHANATISVTDPSVTITNIRVASGVADCAAGITLAAGGDGAVIQDCEFEDGGTAGTELKVAIAVATTVDDLVVKNCSFRTVEGGTITSAITFAGTHDNSRIEHCYFNGDFGTAAIVASAGAGTRMLIANNWIKTKDGEPGIELKSDTTGVIAENYIESTGITDPDAAIVGADCSWFENYVVTADGAAAQPVGAYTEAAIGSVFSVKKTVTKAAIVAGGAALTGTSSGTLLIEDCILQNDTTEIDSAGHAEVIEFYSNNTKGSTSFMTIAASVAASEMRDLAKSTTGIKVVLESGKIVSVKATTEDVTSAGTADVYLIFRRLSEGATVAAAA